MSVLTCNLMNYMGKKNSSKNIMLPHSRAKVKFYKTYLEIYLRVLCNSPYIDVINIYDVFCGMGIYNDGGKGSPIEANDVIKDVCATFPSKTKICLHINDKSRKRVNAVKNYIQNSNGDAHDYTPIYTSLEGEKYLENLSSEIASTPSNTRNLIFIDPYGYKEIRKEIIDKLMSNGRTEVMIFLPISFMNRFTKHALEHDEIAMFQPLCNFVKSFFPNNHPIAEGKRMSHLEYISYLTCALRFGNKYYTTSYHIERSQSNYFALFFLTSNVYGFEKILETKWKLDEKDGNGFELPKQASLFDDLEAEENKRIIFNKLYDRTVAYLSNGGKTNQELYYFALANEFLPKHMAEVLSALKQNGRLEIKEIAGCKTAMPGAFYLNRKEGNQIIVTLKK